MSANSLTERTDSGSGSATLPWEARPARELLRLAWPITVSTLSYSVMTLVDTLLVGHLSAAALAGVGLGGTLAFVGLCFSFGLLRGAKTLVSQAIGAGRREQVGAYLGAALTLAAVISVVTIALGLGLSQVVHWFTEDAGAAEAASTYLAIRILGAPMALAYVALREVRYGQGDARSPMVATVVANLVNVGLASVFIYVFHLGVAGAAWATVVAHTVEVGILALVQRKAGFRMRGMRREHVTALWRIGLPTGLQFTLEVGSFALLAIIVSRMGVLPMAAHQIALQVVHFTFLPGFALAEAASVLAGQAVGAGRFAWPKRIARLSLVVTSVYTGLCTLVLVTLGSVITRGFTSDLALAGTATRLLYVAAAFQLLDGANVVARGVLRGVGDVRVPAVIGVLTSWLATPPLAWLFGVALGWGVVGGWLGLVVEVVAATALLWWRLERDRWHGAARASQAELRRTAEATAARESEEAVRAPQAA